MYAIETELGRFEADTEREAKRALAKAKREAKKQEEQQRAKREQADLRAGTMAANVMRFHLSGTMPRGWRFFADSTWAAKVVDKTDFGRAIKVETEQGRALIDLPNCDQLAGAVENGAGMLVVLFIRHGESEEPQAYTVGVHDGQGALYMLPGCIKSNLFSPARE